MAFGLAVADDGQAAASPLGASAPVDAVYALVADSASPEDQPREMMVAPALSTASPAGTRSAQAAASDVALSDDPDWDFLS
jgi:hypothetical protein